MIQPVESGLIQFMSIRTYRTLYFKPIDAPIHSQQQKNNEKIKDNKKRKYQGKYRKDDGRKKNMENSSHCLSPNGAKVQQKFKSS